MPAEIDVVAAGMVSSVGHDMKTSCAAARAGISRPGEAPCRVTGGDGAPELATAHCVRGLTDGFAGDARLIRLLTQALRDLFSHPGAAELPASVGWYLGIPSPARRRLGLDRIANLQDRSAYEEGLQSVDPKLDHTVRARRILTEALALATGEGTLPDLRAVSTDGQVAFANLVNLAKVELAGGKVGAAVIACVDSLVTEPELRWLNVTRRLKSGAQPVGMAAGEAAAAIMLVPRVRGSSLARLQATRQTRSARDLLSADYQNGDCLTDILLPLDAALGRPLMWIVTDQNGEPQRAAEWASSIVNLRTRVPGYVPPPLWCPVVSFGDTGTASGAVNTCVALHAFERNYASDGFAAIVSRNDGFDAGAVVIGSSRG